MIILLIITPFLHSSLSTVLYCFFSDWQPLFCADIYRTWLGKWTTNSYSSTACKCPWCLPWTSGHSCNKEDTTSADWTACIPMAAASPCSYVLYYSLVPHMKTWKGKDRSKKIMSVFYFMRLEVLIMVKYTVFCDLMPHSLVDSCQSYR